MWWLLLLLLFFLGLFFLLFLKCLTLSSNIYNSSCNSNVYAFMCFETLYRLQFFFVELITTYFSSYLKNKKKIVNFATEKDFSFFIPILRKNSAHFWNSPTDLIHSVWWPFVRQTFNVLIELNVLPRRIWTIKSNRLNRSYRTSQPSPNLRIIISINSIQNTRVYWPLFFVLGY